VSDWRVALLKIRLLRKSVSMLQARILGPALCWP